MSRFSTRKCDECPALHTDVNGWWAIVGSDTQPMFMPYSEANAQCTASDFRLDYCSHKCVGTAFNRWLDTGSVLAVTGKGVVDATVPGL